MPLTNTAIRNAKPTEKPFKLFDELGLTFYRLTAKHDAYVNQSLAGMAAQLGIKLPEFGITEEFE